MSGDRYKVCRDGGDGTKIPPHTDFCLTVHCQPSLIIFAEYTLTIAEELEMDIMTSCMANAVFPDLCFPL